MPLAGTARAYVFTSTRWWSQLKTAASAIYANRHYLMLYRKQQLADRLLKGDGDSPIVIGDVHVHPTATVHPTAVVSTTIYCAYKINLVHNTVFLWEKKYCS